MHSHVCKVMKNCPAFENNVVILFARVSVWSWHSFRPVSKRSVKVLLPQVKSTSEGPSPFISPPKGLRNTKGVDLKIPLIHMPAHTEKSCHQDTSAKCIRPYFLCVQGPL